MTASLYDAGPTSCWDTWPEGWPTLAARHSSSMWCFGSMRMFLERRLFVGVEMVEHYQRIAERRIREAQGQAVTRGDQGALDFGDDGQAS